MSYSWQSPGNQIEKQPVVKLDYNLTRQHRLSGTYNWQVVIARSRSPQRRRRAVPGLAELPQVRLVPAAQRPATLRSTLSPNMVNELRGGIRWGPGYFGERRQQRPADVRRLRTASRSISRTSTTRPHQLAHAERPELAQRLELEHRQHAELAEGQAQPELRRRRSSSATSGRTTSRWCRRSTFGVAANDPATATVLPPRTSRARRTAQLSDARELLRAAHRAGDQYRRADRARRGDQSVRLPRHAAPRRQA